MKNQRIDVRVSEAQKTKLKLMAKREKTTISGLIEMMLNGYLVPNLEETE